MTEFTQTFKSIFSSLASRDREANFESYWQYTLKNDGDILESEQNLKKKKEKFEYFQKNAVRSQIPLANPELFYRNYVKLKDDPKTLDRKTLMLSCIYKFARHEWVGISAAWDVIPQWEHSHSITDKISRYHLCEEFSHIRLFSEMFSTFHLDAVEWVPLNPFMQSVYRFFPRFPNCLMDPLAFVTELMGIIFYVHVDNLLDSIFEDEPNARDRIRELLHEIMIDETAHIGQRRNYVTPRGIKFSKQIIKPLFRMFYKDIPETKYLLDVEKMIEQANEFDYSLVPKHLLEKSWIPTQCQR
ncbi:MAG: hypothetical protein AABZ60_13190 [Planctomycetota bacterium]